MTRFVPLRRMFERLEIDKTEGDTSAFFSLLYSAEMLTKLTIAGLAAAVPDDKDRTRYSVLHRIVRADGIGEWASALDQLLAGPASQFIQPEASIDYRELTQRHRAGEWQFDTVFELRQCANVLGVQADPLGPTAALRQWFIVFASIRNKTRGHGAPLGSDCAQACRHLEKSIRLIADNLALFTKPWAYLHRNLSGKYRVTPISQAPISAEHVQRATAEAVPDGVYISYDSLSRVELLWSDPDLTDFLLPNGRFRGGSFELLSYVTGKTLDHDASPFRDPPQALPVSQTHPLSALDIIGNSFTNVPPIMFGYVTRDTLEEEVRGQLLLEPHRIVTLTGTGGIGKTSLAIASLHVLMNSPANRFDLIMWFSARDVDLLEHGPKPVKPQALTLFDFANAYVDLTAPSEVTSPDFDPVSHLAEALSTVPLGPTLFVFDNFETVVSPADVFRWLDTYARAPNKVLITTRARDFAGDYPIEVPGMTEHQARQLIDSYSRQLGIRDILSAEYFSALVEESAGHPYVIKILLGEVAKSQRPANPERIVASKGELLVALFERTYAKLSVSAQRIFLLLCTWRSVIPEVAVEAVVLRPGNEYIDIDAALDELRKSSLIEITTSPQDDQPFISVPLAAATFGKRKLTASPLKAAVEADMSLLRDFGAARKEDVRYGILPRVRRMLGRARERIDSGEKREEEIRPVLEFLARRSPQFWLDIAEYYIEQRSATASELAKDAYRRYLEAPPEGANLVEIWLRLADLCDATNDYSGAVHALVGMCEVHGVSATELSSAANRINNVIFTLKRLDMPVFETEERRFLVRRVVQVLAQHQAALDATDCSRLAWLHLHVGDTNAALEVAQRGLAIDPRNEHCQRIVERLA